MSSVTSFASRLLAWTLAMTIVLSFHHCSLVQACRRNGTEPQIVSDTKDLVSGSKHIGRIRYHYVDDDCVDRDNTQKPCSDILLMGVGAAMAVDNYDNIARTIVSKTGSSLIVVIADSNPGNIVKFSATKYATLANYVNMQHHDLIPVCGNANETANILIGGHSASGQAALEAAQKGLYDFVPSGFVGLDPYDTSKIDASLLEFPTLDWGFSHTTCQVQVDKAAKGAYKLSSANIGRVLYSIDNHKHDDDDDGMTHCVFTDDGCKVGFMDVCPSNGNHEWVYESVAESVRLFLDALESNFTKEIFELPSTRSGQVSLFVNNDDVDRKGNTDGDKIDGHDKRGSYAVYTHAQLTLALMIVIAAVMVTVSRHQEWLQQWGQMDTPNYGDIFQPLLLR